jgi:hypothetical protein
MSEATGSNLCFSSRYSFVALASHLAIPATEASGRPSDGRMFGSGCPVRGLVCAFASACGFSRDGRNGISTAEDRQFGGR